MELISCYRRWRHPLQTGNGRVSYYNFWNQEPDVIWFTEFLRSRGFLKKYPRAEFAFFSTLGKTGVFLMDRRAYPFTHNRKRIFFTGENVHCDSFVDYRYNMLDFKHIDLSLGFDRVNDERYLRFPLWILEMFPADADIETIKQVCDRLSHQHLHPQRSRFCALVSGNRGPHDTGVLIRTQIVERLNVVNRVDCAGKLLRNTEDLQTVFHDNKAEFLKRYKFFICPENISVDGYVTEKVFHSIGSGCIPIYNGSLNNPEPDVLNHEAILFWEKDGDNSQLIKKVEELWNSPQLYKDFFEQPRLQSHAWEVILEYFNSLEKKIDELFKR